MNKAELCKRLREAFNILERAKAVGATTSEGVGPVDVHFAVGYAKSVLAQALWDLGDAEPRQKLDAGLRAAGIRS